MMVDQFVEMEEQLTGLYYVRHLKHAVVAKGDGNVRLFGFFDNNFGIRDIRSSSMSGSVAMTRQSHVCPTICSACAL